MCRSVVGLLTSQEVINKNVFILGSRQLNEWENPLVTITYQGKGSAWVYETSYQWRVINHLPFLLSPLWGKLLRWPVYLGEFSIQGFWENIPGYIHQPVINDDVDKKHSHGLDTNSSTLGKHCHYSQFSFAFTSLFIINLSFSPRPCSCQL